MALLSDNMIVINNLYEIKLTSTKHNINLNESVTITAKVIDFNGNNISGEKISIYVDKGNFVNGNTNIGQKYIGTTGTNGLSVTYKATENGIINFYCGAYIEEIENLKTGNLQLFANTYKRFTLTTSHSSETVYLYVNEYTKQCFLKYYCNLTSYKKGNSTDGYSKSVETPLIPSNLSQYRPSYEIRTATYRPDIVFVLRPDGYLIYRVEDDKTAGAIAASKFEWHY